MVLLDVGVDENAAAGTRRSFSRPEVRRIRPTCALVTHYGATCSACGLAITIFATFRLSFHLRKLPMSQNLAGQTPGAHGTAATESASVQLSLRLRASDNSDRPIVSNVSAVQAGSGMVLIDFGFVEQRTIE